MAGQVRGEAPFAGGAERRTRDAETARPEPVAEVVDRARPEGDVDERIELEETFALRFREAAAHGDHGVRVAALLGMGVAEVRGESLIGLLADRARVEYEHVRLVCARSLADSQLLERSADALGVVRVHLTAECRDVVPAHRRIVCPGAARNLARIRNGRARPSGLR